MAASSFVSLSKRISLVTLVVMLGTTFLLCCPSSAFRLGSCITRPRTPRQVLGVPYSSLRTLESSESPYETEFVVKKSRFLGFARHASHWEDAKVLLHDIQKEHGKASHVCYGYYSSGGGGEIVRSSDDGEPTGTAGAPIVSAIQGLGLSQVMCVVVRYYGGIPLGTGGLIRAYGGTARLVLKTAPVVELWPTVSLTFTLADLQYVGAVYACCNNNNNKQQQGTVRTITSEDYQANGSVHWTVTCDMASLETLKASLNDATKGTIVFGGEVVS
jgi:uncharacterized YigZ family protein